MKSTFNPIKSLFALTAICLFSGCAATKTVTIKSSPEGAMIFLNGQPAGAAPVKTKLQFKPRNTIHEVVARQSGFQDGATAIAYEPKNRTEYVVILEKFRKTAKVSSEPEGATVFLNGQQAGITPLTKELVFDNAGQQIELTLRKEGYKDGKDNIAYEPPDKTDYLVKLEKVEAVPIELVSVEPERTDKGVKLALVRKPTLAYLEVIERSPNVASVTRVTANEDKAVQIGAPILSPTEDIVLFGEFIEEEKGSTYSNIQKQKVGSSAKTRLTYGKYRDLFPAFTRDGKRVVFSSNRTSGNPTLWMINAEGPGGITMLTHTLAEDFSPSVSPDDRLVAFASNPPEAEESQIWTVPMNGSLMTQLREGESPQVSPDGKRIVFTRRDKITKKRQLWLMSVDGAEETQLTQNTDFETTDAHWSPDGKWIVYASDEGLDSQQRHNWDIWLMASDGSRRTQLTTNGSWDDGPCWDYKGEAIYFRSNRGGAWNVWRFKPILPTL